MFRPSAASDRIRKGIRMARNQYSEPTSGSTTKATSSSRAIAQRSWKMGKIC